MSEPRGGWSFWIDRGGTFTDVVARDPEGALHVQKLLSENPERYVDAPLEAIRRALGVEGDVPLDPAQVGSIRMGTTVATNALLERGGTPVCLVITEGFQDLLQIGTQARPDLFALEIVKPEPLVTRAVGLAEQVDAAGRIERSPNLARLRPRLEDALDAGITSLAVVLKNAYRNPAHELAVGELAREVGFVHVGLSHRVANEINLTARGDTTTADAYLTPILRRYVQRFRDAVGSQVPLRFMQSSGGLADALHFQGKDAVFSGPAGGVVAVGKVAELAGIDRVIGFDMGGTSTDVCRIDVREGPDRVYERVVAGVRLKAPSLNVNTIAAGGGSLLKFDGRRLTVGPESAGADPGPVCYRRPGGLLAVTDANAVLGRVQPEFFPACFGPEADQPIDVAAARATLGELASEVQRATARESTVEQVAAGFVRIANDNMARAIREISVARGYDVSEYGLVCFGGAAGQHACAIAASLGVHTVVLHPLGGVLSAYGIGLAEVVQAGVEPLHASLAESEAAMEAGYGRLEQAGQKALKAQGIKANTLHHVRSADLRYRGVDATLNVREPDRKESTVTWETAFTRAHERLFGFARPHHPVEVVNLRVDSIGAPRRKKRRRKAAVVPAPLDLGQPRATVDVWFDVLDPDGIRSLASRATPIHARADLKPGHVLPGPALISEDVSTCVVDPGWSARVDAHGNLILTADTASGPANPEESQASPSLAGEEPALVEAFQELVRTMLEDMDALPADAAGMLLEQGEGFGLSPAACREVLRSAARELNTQVELEAESADAALDSPALPREQLSTACDPVTLEIMGNLYMSIAEQMGATLRRVSLSVNIKERLDFSCAVFDRDGGLVANAPHIPVHLGAMSESVRAVVASRGDDMRPGDVYLTNDPYQGGSHLPDITVITPVFVGGSRVFFVANRGHHADVGGIVPGSMPPFSRTIEEEGVRIHDLLLVREGALREQELRGLLAAGPHPVRGIDERIADLEAQVAANTQGVHLLRRMVDRYGLEAVSAYMSHVQADAAAAMREAIAALPDGESTFFDFLDDGARVQVTVRIDGDRATIDFAGTDPVLPGNLNAPRAVSLAAVLYVFRTLVRRPIPLNSGCLQPLEVRIPPGSLLDPQPPAAVVGGNVETSQRIVDTLYGALGKLGAAQGTMNNLTFGDATFGYYETICGGAGAGLGFDGASAVHTHMTNTRITDPEVLEQRFPVRLRRFGIRRGSGGAGVFRGGDGVVREVEFLRPCQAAILSERRALGPFGANGAAAGAPGRNRLVRQGRAQQLPGKVRVEVGPGDVLSVETPGGGGYDPSPREWAALDPAVARRWFREGRYRGPTTGIAMRHVQANLVVVPAAQADAFAEFCRLNPGPCPLIERLPPGDPITRRLARGADLRTDLPRYRVHRSAGHEDVDDLLDLWRDDHVAFLLGCSFSAEQALLEAGIPVRHVDEHRNVPMFRTRRRTRRAGPFAGDLVVTMRPVERYRAKIATQVTEPYLHAHGGPVHVGDHQALGIAALGHPDWGDAVTIHPGEVPVFWACGVTSQLALRSAIKAGILEQALTHAPGHMFLGDLTNEELLGSGMIPPA